MYAESANNNYQKGMARALEGYYYFVKKNRDQAINAYTESIRLMSQTDSIIGKCKVINNATSIAGSLNARENAIKFGEMALQHEDTLRKAAPRILYDAYNMLGVNLSRSGDYYYSNKYLDKANALNRSAKLKITDALLSRSANARWQGDYELAQALLQEALDISQENKNSRMAVQTMLSIASMLRENGRHEQAHEWYQRIWIELKKNNFSATKDLNFYHIQMGNLLTDQKNFSKAEDHFQAALQLSRSSRDTLMDIHALMGIAELRHNLKKTAGSLTMYKQALTLAEKARLQQQIVLLLIHSSRVFSESGEQQQAILNLEKAIAIANAINYKDQLPEAYKALSEVYESSGQYDQALAMQKQYNLLNDSLKTESHNAQQSLSVRLATEEYNLKLAQQQLVVLEHKQSAQTLLVWGLAATLIACIFMAALLFNRNRLLKTRQSALEERETARRKAEELKAFNYAVSHDLKSPLSNAERYIDLLQSQKAIQADQRLHNHLERFRHLVIDMKSMIEGMTAYAHADNLELRRVNINTELMVGNIVNLVRQSAPERSIHFNIGELPPINGDPLLLRQVFANLLGNAAKFTRYTSNPRIHISGHVSDDGFADISVADNGAGIPPEGMSRLFQLFKTAHDRQQFEGTGAGLSIVKRIVERHGGAVRAESAGSNRGATFTVRFPASA